MSEIRSGLRHLLANPRVYDSFQYFVGAYAWRKRFVREFVNPVLRAREHVIDIGCGTGDILQYLPHHVSYVGFDRNAAYIEAARRRFPDRDACFECESVGPGSGAKHAKFGIALATGLMHHLNDAEAATLLQAARDSLEDTGRLFLLDPVYTEGQSRLARYVVSKDRGQNVRTVADSVDLCKTVFDSVEYHVDMSPILIPYTGIVITCSGKLKAGQSPD